MPLPLSSWFQKGWSLFLCNRVIIFPLFFYFFSVPFSGYFLLLVFHALECFWRCFLYWVSLIFCVLVETVSLKTSVVPKDISLWKIFPFLPSSNFCFHSHHLFNLLMNLNHLLLGSLSFCTNDLRGLVYRNEKKKKKKKKKFLLCQ